MEQKRKTIEWHPAFTASLQIEFEDEADKIIFESEHLVKNLYENVGNAEKVAEMLKLPIETVRRIL